MWRHAVDNDAGTQFHGNPALVDNLILFGTDQGVSGQVGALYALDRRTGVRQWSLRLDPGIPSDLSASGRAVFGVLLDDRLVGVEASTGRPIWQPEPRRTVDTETVLYGDIRTPSLASSCVMTGELVYIAGRDGNVCAYDVRDGKRHWETRADTFITTRLCATNRELVYGAVDYALHYLDFATGRATRSQRTRFIPHETMAWLDGRLYFLGGFEDARPEDLVCVDPDSGTVLWQARIPDTVENAYWYVPRLHFWQGNVIVGSTHGLVVAYDARTGEERWQTRLESPLRGIGSTPDVLLVGNFDGMLFALKRPGHTR